VREDQERRPFWRHAIVTVPLILLAGIASGRLSNSGYGNPWFDALAKPEIMPPGWAFGAAWTTLYILLGVAFAFILRAKGTPGRNLAIVLFVAQLLVNFAWSPVFFGMYRARLALFLIVLMLALSIAVAFLFARIDRRAGWAFIPYLAWLGFASYLNYRIVELNPGG
jgi:benzodiazapine receptor